MAAKNRCSILLVLFLLSLCFLVGPSQAKAKEPKYLFKMATLAPKGVGWARQFELIMMPKLEELAQGDIKFKAYWGGIMGDDEDIIKKMRVGQLDTAGISCQGAPMICPEFTALQLPFLFSNYEEVDYVRARMFEFFDDVCRENGFKLNFWLDQDFDQIYSSRFRFDRIEDFQRARFMTWYGELEKEVLVKLGASPIPVNVPEAASSMRQHVFDSIIAPALGILGFQGYQTMKYINPIRIRYAPALAVFTNEAWGTLPEEYQTAIMGGRAGVEIEFCEAVRIDNQKALDAMVKYGLVLVKPNPGQVEEIRRRTRPVWDELVGREYRRETLDLITGYLEDYQVTQAGK
ncbi:MAG: TRAP transporter substrate-binding protein DctP [Proteobacteria bacterium]|nr:TRAP transporter substrate-binding protein DctP [Pseudomonadota bacterium]